MSVWVHSEDYKLENVKNLRVCSQKERSSTDLWSPLEATFAAASITHLNWTVGGQIVGNVGTSFWFGIKRWNLSVGVQCLAGKNSGSSVVKALIYFSTCLPPAAHLMEEDSVTSLPHQHEAVVEVMEAMEAMEVAGTATEKAAPLFWDIKWNV